MHAFHQRIRDFIMGKMSPPNQHIRRGEQGLREALFSFIQGCCTNCPIRSGQPLGERGMNTVGIVYRYVWVCSLMTKLIPNSDLRHGYSIDPFVSQTARHLSALPVLISLLQILKEGEDRRVDFLGALLLYPVATAGQDDLLKGGNSLMHPFDPLVHTRDLKAWILIAPEEEGWLRNVGSAVGGKEFPVAIDIAIPVQATAKAGSGELGGVIVDVWFGEPGWQGRGIAHLFKRVGLGIGRDGMPAFRGSSVARNS